MVTFSGGGGSGASGKAILAGDKVALILVLTAGTGYSTAPTVVVEAPPKPLGVKLEMVPKLTEEGPAGSYARVESAASLSGPWTMWTNVTVGTAGTVLVDLSPGSAARFYRAVAEQGPVGPTGFVWIVPGTFVMGSPVSEPDRDPVEMESPSWLAPTMIGAFLIGLFWIVIFYVSQTQYPIPNIGAWNMVVGFAFIGVGFSLATRWR